MIEILQLHKLNIKGISNWFTILFSLKYYLLLLTGFLFFVKLLLELFHKLFQLSFTWKSFHDLSDQLLFWIKSFYSFLISLFMFSQRNFYSRWWCVKNPLIVLSNFIYKSDNPQHLAALINSTSNRSWGYILIFIFLKKSLVDLMKSNQPTLFGYEQLDPSSYLS